jgi:demethylmenaquinone methyltransferase / 2-methoxy-6-polyprenyl-1,4-benzoquinol methylase
MNTEEKKRETVQTDHHQTRRRQGEMVYAGYRQVPADEKARLVQRHFSAIARKYDLMNTILSFGFHHLWKRTAVRMLELKAGDRVIDVCGGTADLSLLATRYTKSSGRVIVCDMNWAMLEAGRPKAVRAPFGETISWVQGDAENLSCADQSFDAVMVGFGVRNLTHLEKGFREMHRVLKPGGKLMCLEFSKPPALWFRLLYDLYSFILIPLAGRLFTGSLEAYTYLFESIRMFPSPEALASLLEEIGFSQVTYHKLTNGIAVIHRGVKQY